MAVLDMWVMTYLGVGQPFPGGLLRPVENTDIYAMIYNISFITVK